jgi:hypothetical protein
MIRDMDSDLTAFSYAEGGSDRPERWVVRRDYESIGSNGATDEVLSFRRSGGEISNRSVTSGRASEIESALELARTAVSEHFSTDSMIVKEVEKWRDNNRKKIDEVLGQIGQRFREVPVGIVEGTLPKNKDESKTLQEALEAFVANDKNLSAQLPKSHIYLGNLKLNTQQYRNNLLKAINHKREDLMAVRLWGIHNWDNLLVRLMPVLNGRVIAIVDCVKAPWYEGTRIGYKVRLKGFPDDYEELVWPSIFHRGNGLVHAFHRYNPEKLRPADKEFAQ